MNSRYDLRQTQIVANSDGGEGYSADRFKDCFYESDKPLYVQLDAFHVSQALTRALHGDKKWIGKIQRAVRHRDQDRVIALIDTYESQLDDEKWVEQVEAAKTYLLNHWDRLFD